MAQRSTFLVAHDFTLQPVCIKFHSLQYGYRKI